MKQRTENEVVKAGEIQRNVKLGRGGIRESNSSRRPFNSSTPPHSVFAKPQTLPTLDKLVQYKLLSAAEAKNIGKLV